MPPPKSVFVPVLVTSVAVAVAAGMVVMATFDIRLRDDEVALQAPEHTAMTATVTQIPTQQWHKNSNDNTRNFCTGKVRICRAKVLICHGRRYKI